MPVVGGKDSKFPLQEIDLHVMPDCFSIVSSLLLSRIPPPSHEKPVILFMITSIALLPAKGLLDARALEGLLPRGKESDHVLGVTVAAR